MAGRGHHEARKHHFVPCALLSKFGEGAGRDALVWVWDKSSGSVWRSKVEAIAVQNDLYTLPAEIELPDVPEWFPDRYKGPQGLERNFADIEGILGALIDRASRTLEVFEPGSDVLDFVLRTLVLLEFRTPSHLETGRQQMELMANLASQIDANRRACGDESEEAARLEVPFKENKHILLGQSLAVSDAIVEHHHGRNWSFWVAASDHQLIIGDNPVTRCFARQPAQWWDSPAPATPNAFYLLPLTRNLLLAGDDRVVAALRHADERLVGFHNTLALHWADRFVFSYGPSFTLLMYEGNPPAFRVLDDPSAFLFEMTPERFGEFVARGVITKPKRWEVNMPEDLRHLVPSENLADIGGG